MFKMAGSRQSLPSWISAAASRVDIEGMNCKDGKTEESNPKAVPSDVNLGFGARAFAAAGAAVLSAVIVNPLDVAKVFH